MPVYGEGTDQLPNKSRAASLEFPSN